MANKYVSVMPSGTNNYLTPSEAINRTISDFWTPGVSGNITNTSGVAPSTGSFAANAQGTPNMTVAISAGNGIVRATPTGGNQQCFNVRSDASENVTHAANATGSTVYDFIYIVLAAATLNNPSVTGTDAMTFVIQRSTTQYVDSNTAPSNSELLAEVTVTNGASSIGNSSITDRRRHSTIPTTGWLDFNEVPVYASATTMTVSAGLAATLQVGDKLRLRQSGSDKYFYLTGISGTTTTINGGTDYTLTNVAIGKASYSKAATPTGFPTYFNYTPTLTNITVNNGTLLGRFSMNGKHVELYIKLTWGSTTSCAGTVSISLPVTTSSNYATAYGHVIGTCRYHDASAGPSLYPGDLSWLTSSTAEPETWNAAGTFSIVDATNSTKPFTWTTSDILSIRGSYEAA